MFRTLRSVMIVLLVSTFALAGCSSGSQPKAEAQPVPAAAAAAPTVAPAQPTATVPRPTAIPPTATAVPQPTKAPTIAKVGERVESSGIALTINGVSKTESMGQFLKAGDGKTYLIADVTVENTGRDKSPYNPLYFKVKDSDGYEYNAGISLDDKALKSGDLAAGEKARGTVAFTVPKAAKGFVVSYQPLVILGGYQTIRVALE